ncbi:MAG: maleylacetoacetate isomerase [Sphingobium sp. 32-64-5]|nr:MAG: maleylacetoacetate isomerase [Sphingobium sp. 32-64-5]
MDRVLYGYWRSTAAYRVRIALALKGLSHEAISINLRTGEQKGDAFRAINRQGFVPCLVDGPRSLSQSLAILEYLEEIYPDPPLIPGDAAERAHVRALAQIVACDIHPLNNLRVLKYLSGNLGLEQEDINAWARHWIEAGFAVLEDAAAASGAFLAGNKLSIADICLVPQLYNARRVETDLSPFPALLDLEARLLQIPAFADAQPERQPDAVPV